MEYFFITGNHPSLSLAEILSVFGLNEEQNNKLVENSIRCLPNAIILKSDKEIKAGQLIKKLGGIIKIGEIKNAINSNNYDDITKEAINIIDTGSISGKFKFGISYYGNANFNTKKLAMAIKQSLRNMGISCRWVASSQPTLSSVVVEQNKLTKNGIEFTLVGDKNNLFIGKTLAVQPFKELSFRDYGRPARDDYSGMLPPKLAQIMINLSRTKPGEIILDPFCGSGTILTEAMLMGYDNLIGADISEKAVADSKKNIDWIKKSFNLKNIDCELYNKDAAMLSRTIKPSSISAIITEPYLGPSRGKLNIEKTSQRLENLYSKSLTEFKKILKPGGLIVMVWPVFRESRLNHYLSPNLGSFKIINPIPKILLNSKAIKLTERKTMIYGREGQKTFREIVILSP